MTAPEFISGSPVPAHVLPEQLGIRLGPNAGDKIKLMIAKALLPLPPEELGMALAFLSRNETGPIQQHAEASIVGLPSSVRVEIVRSQNVPGEALDVFAHVMRDDGEMLRLLVRNEACYDETVRWMARNLRGEVLEFIARNQRRLLRYPPIIESLIANPATPTPVLAPVVETALRNDVETGRIAGFRELARAFFGDDLNQFQGQGPLKEDEEGQIAEGQSLVSQAEQGASNSAAFEDLLSRGESERAVDDDEPLIRSAKSLEKEAEQGDGRNNLWAQIQEMSVAEKVRLAVMGDSAARAILIRDPKKVVGIAVMKSPRLTLKEVASFASTKTISDEVIREIAKSREYTKNYAVRLALVKNPKCPPSQALTFLRTLRLNDIRRMAKARDVPAYISRAARQSANRRS